MHWATIATLPFLFSIYPIYKNFYIASKSDLRIFEVKRQQIFPLAFPMFITYFAFLVNNNADVFILKSLGITTANVGIYKTANNIALISATLLVALNTTVQPKMTQLDFKHELDELRKVTQKSTKLIFWLSLPIYILLFGLAPYIMQIYGDSFLPGTIPLMIMVIGQLVNTATGPVAQLLNATGFHKQFTYMSLMGAFLNIGFNFILIVPFGIIGASIAASLSLIIWNLIGVWYIYKKFGFIIAYFPKFGK